MTRPSRQGAEVRTRFDQFAKAIAQSVLELIGVVRTQEEISTVQQVDTWFEPRLTDPSESRADAADADPRTDGEPLNTAQIQRNLGVLGRIADQACLLEFFHQPPRMHAVQDCIGKQHQMATVRARRARAAKRARPPLPPLWLFSAGRPNTVIEQYQLQPMPRWPRGFMHGSAGQALRLVILPELPERRDTLILRLFGAGVTYLRAVRDLAELPTDSWEHDTLKPFVLAFQVDPRSHFHAQGLDDKAMAYVNELREIYANWEAKTLARGQQRLLLKQLGLKFGALSPDTVARVESATDEQLERWAGRVLTAEQLSDVFGEP